jgi:hypothetical protein
MPGANVRRRGWAGLSRGAHDEPAKATTVVMAASGVKMPA